MCRQMTRIDRWQWTDGVGLLWAACSGYFSPPHQSAESFQTETSMYCMCFASGWFTPFHSFYQPCRNSACFHQCVNNPRSRTVSSQHRTAATESQCSAPKYELNRQPTSSSSAAGCLLIYVEVSGLLVWYILNVRIFLSSIKKWY